MDQCVGEYSMKVQQIVANSGRSLRKIYLPYLFVSRSKVTEELEPVLQGLHTELSPPQTEERQPAEFGIDDHLQIR
jgi:hypothetical protein